MNDHFRQPWNNITRIGLCLPNGEFPVSEVTFEDAEQWHIVWINIRNWVILAQFTLRISDTILVSNLGTNRRQLIIMTHSQIQSLFHGQDIREFRGSTS